MSMKNDTVTDIIDLCIDINKLASKIYIMLSKTGDNEELKRFWMEMADEEKTHAIFWHNVRKTAKEYRLPHIFDDPSATRNELEKILQQVQILLGVWKADQNIKNALIMAYRLEYYMLHPAFEILYHTLKPLSDETDPEDMYDRHITRFIEMFVRYGKVSPELELLGETLQNLWQRNKVLAKLVMIDSLTGLLNRRGFLVLAKELFYLGRRKKENMGMLMIDIDKFKEINDKHGHPEGDEVLKGVAESLKTNVRKSDIVGRFGGEEFIVLFPGIQPTALKRVAEMIRQGVENARPAGIPVTISIGVAQGIIQADPEAQLFTWITKADERLYKAKENGRNCVVSDI